MWAFKPDELSLRFGQACDVNEAGCGQSSDLNSRWVKVKDSEVFEELLLRILPILLVVYVWKSPPPLPGEAALEGFKELATKSPALFLIPLESYEGLKLISFSLAEEILFFLKISRATLAQTLEVAG